MVYNKYDLMNDFEKIGLKRTDTVLIHSSYKAVGEVEGGPHTVLDAFEEYMDEGLLIFPTHTWADKEPVYHVQTQKPCIGILPTLFIERSGVKRSLHPTHSVAAIGKGAEEYLAGDEHMTTPCGRTGCWGKLYDMEAKILFLGDVIIKNTFLHGVEEWHNIPNRLTPEYTTFTVIDGDRKFEMKCKRHVAYDHSQHYIKMRDPFLKKGIAIKGQIGDALSYLCDAKGMADMTSEYLVKNKDLFGNGDPIPKEWYM